MDNLTVGILKSGSFATLASWREMYATISAE